MDDRDTSILTQVAFKEAGEQARALGLDLLDPGGQASFEEVFSYLTESLFLGVRTQLGGGKSVDERAAQLVQGAFPGTTVVQQQQQPPQYQGQPAQGFPPAVVQPYQGQPNGVGVGPHNYQLTVKGNQFGPLPDWLYAAAANDNVHEVYDNRDQPAGSRRPMFKSTAGGRDAPAYWAPGR